MSIGSEKQDDIFLKKSERSSPTTSLLTFFSNSETKSRPESSFPSSIHSFNASVGDGSCTLSPFLSSTPITSNEQQSNQTYQQTSAYQPSNNYWENYSVQQSYLCHQQSPKSNPNLNRRYFFNSALRRVSSLTVSVSMRAVGRDPYGVVVRNNPMINY